MPTRGVPEVPMVHGMTTQHRRFLQDLRESVIDLRQNQAPLAPPTNVRVTPQSFGNLVQWTRSTGADYFEVLWNTSASVINSQVVDVGDSAQWQDVIGQSGVKRYYWVRAHKRTGARSLEAGPGIGTSLAAGTGVNPPTPPPPGRSQAIDERTGGRDVYGGHPR